MQKGLLDREVYAIRILGFFADGIDVIRVFYFIDSGNFSSFDFNPHLIIFFSIYIFLLHLYSFVYLPWLVSVFLNPLVVFIWLEILISPQFFFKNLLALVILLSQFFLTGEVNCFTAGGKGRQGRAAESRGEGRPDAREASCSRRWAKPRERFEEAVSQKCSWWLDIKWYFSKFRRCIEQIMKTWNW